MTDVTRRQFLRNASIGAAAAGVLAVGGPAIVSAIDAGEGTASASAPSQDPVFEGSDIFARVIDAKAGSIKIFVGTKEVDYTNQALAQQLLRAAQ